MTESNDNGLMYLMGSLERARSLFSYGDSGWGRRESGKEEAGVFGKCAAWLKLIRGLVEAADRMADWCHEMEVYCTL